MPRLYPECFPPELKSDPAAAAEFRVYEAFADDLPEEYLVIHRIRWLDRPPRGRPHDGECDFLVAHPDLGMIVLEVKGGLVACDDKTGRWTSRSAGGTVHDIRNPFEQAMTSHHALKRKIESLPHWAKQGVPVGHAVAFPDCAKTTFLGPDGREEIVLDAADLTRPAAAVERAFRFWQLAPGEHWKRHGLAMLGRLFVHREFARVRLGVQLQQLERDFLRLTAEQARVLDLLRHQRRAAISGCAGSGKTMLAVEKARRLASEGFRVLVTCFNRALAEFIRFQLPPPKPRRRSAGSAAPGAAAGAGEAQLDLFDHSKVEVESFHALAGSWAQRAGIELPAAGGAGEARRLYDQALPEALLRATEKLTERYDAIIVDEGQDFHEDWWVPLQSLLADPDHGILYVFYDDNQSIYTPGARLPIETPPFPLTTNCRNTRAIHSFVVRYYRSRQEPQVAGPEQGRDPVFRRYRDEAGLRECLRRTLHELVHEEGVPEREIVVLSPYGRERSALWKDPRYGNLALTDAWPPAPNFVQFSTIHAFKGLERAVVILAEVERPARGSLDELLYVGGSRAKSHLVVIAQEEALAEG